MCFTNTLGILSQCKQEERKSCNQDFKAAPAWSISSEQKLSHTKMVTAAFHLNNEEAKHELKVYNRGGQPVAHMPHMVHWMVSGGALQLGKIFQMKNVPQLISSYIRDG